MDTYNGGLSEQTSPVWATESPSDRPPGEPEPGVSQPDWVQSEAAAVRGTGRAHPGRVALGATVLAAERLRPGASATEAFTVGVGLAQQTASEVRTLARRAMGPPSRFASRTVRWALERSGLPADRGPLARSRDRINRVVDNARTRGEATLAAGRSEASALINSTVADSIAWAESNAIPQIVDDLVPHLVDSVMPRVIEGVMPEVRSRVVPVIIDDLSNDPRVRDLVLEQSQGLMGEAAHNVRSATAQADDRVEHAFRRLVGPKHEPSLEAPPRDRRADEKPRDE